ncbi:DUF4249 domain-containing protein [Spirosoma sp. KNUC1025]|uniref:DUF4249 domain-containing protein n=1 Tax=Spirosoma sp. KNUC1025 TaxID=2894082 RepID=UPI003865F0FD|nr:DUF4249 domain-containing protein [Spirosoma sp. KNUC1025]
MKRFSFLVALLVAVLTLNSCTTVIDAKLDTGPTQLSVDANLTDQPGAQTIRLTRTAAYFDSSTPPAATSATVSVSDDAGKTYVFSDSDNDGYYVWQPKGTDTLGHIGRTYQLNITYQNETYRASSRMNRVPPIDSLIFVKRKLNPLSKNEGYRAEFYARDIPNEVNHYRIRFFRNGELQNEPQNIIISEDGGFRGASTVTDGLVFIVPIRRAINPDSLYVLNDKVKVEVQSITSDAFDFWSQLRTQITNGGLFASPPANVPTNIVNTNPAGRKATGFFITSAVRSFSAVAAPPNIRTRED